MLDVRAYWVKINIYSRGIYLGEGQASQIDIKTFWKLLGAFWLLFTLTPLKSDQKLKNLSLLHFSRLWGSESVKTNSSNNPKSLNALSFGSPKAWTCCSFCAHGAKNTYFSKYNNLIVTVLNYSPLHKLASFLFKSFRRGH